jgi:outer membrane protein OmpA-like peptidoglycan-associated protein
VPQGDHPDPARRGCPDADQDRDGIYDSGDACPTVSAGLISDPARPGCPLADADGDSVPDVQDACPRQAGAPSTNPRRNGCPGLSVVENGQVRIRRPIHFRTNSDRIHGRSNAVLRAVADTMAVLPQIRRLSIEGHTDEVGSSGGNLDLSRRRAASVMAWLVTHGVDPQRLTAEGFGETRPVMQGRSRRALAANRRVEFRIVDPPLAE